MALTKVTGQLVLPTTDLTVGVLTVTNTLAVGGTVSVGGTLTYEDVTNVDSVGLITARAGVNVGSGITLSKDGDIFATGVTTSGSFVSNGEVTIPTWVVHTGDSNTKFGFEGPDTITAETAGSERLRVTSAGKVGIGDADPDEALHVYATGAGIKVDSNGDSAVRWATSGTNKYSLYHNNSANALIFYDNGNSAERIRLDSSGRLLVGATANQNNLGSLIQVAASGSNASVSLNRYTADAHPPYLYFFKSRNASVNGQTVVQSGDSLGNVMFYGSDGTDAAAAAELKVEVDASPGGGDMPSRFVFKTSADGSEAPSERMRIDSAGNVRIGASNTGRLIVGHTASRVVAGGEATLQVQRNSSEAAHFIRTSNDAGAPILALAKSRSSAGAACVAGDNIGVLGWYPHDGTDCNHAAAEIHALVASGIGGNDVPGDLVFKTNSGTTTTTERMRIASGGKILIGTDSGKTNLNAGSDSTGQLLQMVGASNDVNYCASVFAYSGTSNSDARGAKFQLHRSRGTSDGTNTILVSNDLIGALEWKGNDGTNFTAAARIDCYVDDTPGTDDMPGRITFRTSADGSGNPTERMRINAAGSVRFGTTLPVSSSYTGVEIYAGNQGEIRCGTTGTGNTTQVRFYNGNGEVGSIKTNASATTYYTSSDYRLKENAVSISDGIARLKLLKPYRFNWKKHPGTTIDGFFAHEVTPAVPEAVSGEKDKMKPRYYKTGDTLPSGKNVGDLKGYSETEIQAQSMDHSKLVPLITAALQEAITEIETLKAEVTALKSS